MYFCLLSSYFLYWPIRIHLDLYINCFPWMTPMTLLAPLLSIDLQEHPASAKHIDGSVNISLISYPWRLRFSDPRWLELPGCMIASQTPATSYCNVAWVLTTSSTTRDRLIHAERNSQVINAHTHTRTRRCTHFTFRETPPPKSISSRSMSKLFEGGDTCSKVWGRKDKHTLICVWVCVRETKFIWSPRRGL